MGWGSSALSAASGGLLGGDERERNATDAINSSSAQARKDIQSGMATARTDLTSGYGKAQDTANAGFDMSQATTKQGFGSARDQYTQDMGTARETAARGYGEAKDQYSDKNPLMASTRNQLATMLAGKGGYGEGTVNTMKAGAREEYGTGMRGLQQGLQGYAGDAGAGGLAGEWPWG